MKPLFFSFMLAAITLTVSCGGGSLDSETNTERPLVLVNAGPDKVANEQTNVSLEAQAEGQSEALSYRWTSIPAITITQDNADSGLASFVSPVVTSPQIYTFTAIVTDAQGNRGTDEQVITINPVNALPLAVIDAPVFEGLPNLTYPAGESIVLEGSNSDDTDPPANQDPIAQYAWQQTAGQPALANVSTQGNSLAFITPILDEANTITLSLLVTDQEGGQHSQSITLNIQSAGQTLPKVDAGVSHQVFSGESILLTGNASTNIAASRPLTIEWLNDSQLTPIIDDRQALQTFAIAPLTSAPEDITFTLRVTDMQNNQVEDSLTVTVLPLPIQPLNDSGVIQQATATGIFSTHQNLYPGQDGQRGQDIIHAHNLSAKAGRGDQGFDFTRLDAIGDEVDDPSQPWRCVRDNITGLIWEAKSAPATGDLHDNQHTYSWFQEENNGGFEGDGVGVNTMCSLTNCNTSAYIAQVNTQGLCNFRDWRLPTHEELMSIVHFGKTDGVQIDTTYFPNTTALLAPPVWYWTRESSADGISGIGAQNAWAIDFSSGNDNFLGKSTPARIRLVRAGR
jgi:hypothetical protein